MKTAWGVVARIGAKVMRDDAERWWQKGVMKKAEGVEWWAKAKQLKKAWEQWMWMSGH